MHWQPPTSAIDAAHNALSEQDTHSYCADDGLPALREALTNKLKIENGLVQSAVMVQSAWVYERMYVYVCVRERKSVCVCDRESVSFSLLLWYEVGACVRERDSVCV